LLWVGCPQPCCSGLPLFPVQSCFGSTRSPLHSPPTTPPLRNWWDASSRALVQTHPHSPPHSHSPLTETHTHAPSGAPTTEPFTGASNLKPGGVTVGALGALQVARGYRGSPVYTREPPRCTRGFPGCTRGVPWVYQGVPWVYQGKPQQFSGSGGRSSHTFSRALPLPLPR